VKKIDNIPKTVLGAAWGPQKERMDSSIYFPLFLVLAADGRYSIFYLSADLQERRLFRPRAALSETARRAGWRGFIYDLRSVHDRFVRLR
jgi:type II restriction enzyme